MKLSDIKKARPLGIDKPETDRRILSYINDNYYELCKMLSSGGKGDFMNLTRLNFKDSASADYESEEVQLLYALRYHYAFAYEYYRMYSRVLDDPGCPEKLKVLSVGCGNLIDYWSLNKALVDSGKDIDVEYTGVDILDWNHRFAESSRIKQTVCIEDIREYLKRQDVLDFNVIIFPKSMVELCAEDDTVDDICDEIRKKMAGGKMVYLLVSSRFNPECFNELHMSEFENGTMKVEDAICTAGYRNIEEQGYYAEEGSYISDKNISFQYPIGVKYFLKHEIKNLCPMRKAGGSCGRGCDECVVARYPMVKNSYVNYYFFRLERLEK